MSLATRPKRPSETFLPSPDLESAPVTPPTRTRRILVAEAPERGTCREEAPESRRGRPVEGPDAGEGRASYLEHEFTHGRSQS